MYNRQKDADSRGYVKCVTCPAYGYWKGFQAGHFLAGRTKGILFDDRGIHAQCWKCNMFGGEGYEYGIFMEKRYGKKVINDLRKLKQSSGQWTRTELEKHKLRYKKLLENYASE